MPKKVDQSIPFQTLLIRNGSRVSEPGKRMQNVYADSFDKDGVATVIVSGQRDIQEYINSFADDCDIYKILGDIEAANGELPGVDIGNYLDVSDLPDNYHELHRIMNKAEEAFNGLPADVRREYSNNYREFIADFGSDRFSSLFVPTSDLSSDPDRKSEEVNSNE